MYSFWYSNFEIMLTVAQYSNPLTLISSNELEIKWQAMSEVAGAENNQQRSSLLNTYKVS